MKYKLHNRTPLALLLLTCSATWSTAGYGQEKKEEEPYTWQEVWETAQEVTAQVKKVMGVYGLLVDGFSFVDGLLNPRNELTLEDVVSRIEEAEELLLRRLEEQDDLARRRGLNAFRGETEAFMERFERLPGMGLGHPDLPNELLALEREAQALMSRVEVAIRDRFDPLEAYHLASSYIVLAAAHTTVMQTKNLVTPNAPFGARTFALRLRNEMDAAYRMVGSKSEACSFRGIPPFRGATSSRDLQSPAVENNFRKSEIYKLFYDFGFARVRVRGTTHECRVREFGPLCRIDQIGFGHQGDCFAYPLPFRGGGTFPSDHFDECLTQMFRQPDAEFNEDPIVAGLQDLLREISDNLGLVPGQPTPGGTFPTTDLQRSAFVNPFVEDALWSDEQPVCDNRGRYYIIYE